MQIIFAANIILPIFMLSLKRIFGNHIYLIPSAFILRFKNPISFIVGLKPFLQYL
jgi:hypothetical protein